MERILIFDTTLRDGEQSPGATMNPAEKLRLAHALDELGVDIIEAGFPVSSPDDLLAVRKVGRELRRPVIAALARCNSRDITAAAEALQESVHPRIHVFIATSPIHLSRKLKISEDECVERAVASVEEALRHTDDVEFSAEDATRTPLPFLARVVEAVARAGAKTINLPDTVGYAHPSEIRHMISFLRETVPGLDEVILSVHCHNDLGLATANSLAGVEGGARQVECTINGIGERAGNAGLEEVVMALQVRRDLTGCTTGINTQQIYPTSRLLSQITGMHPQPNKAVVGKNAFAHEAGIHQDGMLKERSTYEIMDPRMVGVPRSRLVLGKHSGRHALQSRYKELGHDVREEDLERAYRLFKLLADQKKAVLDEDLLAILHHGALDDVPVRYRLENLEVQCGGRWSTAKVTIRENGEEPMTATAKDDGPIAASFAAIVKLLDRDVQLDELTIRAATPGRDAVGEVALQLKVGDRGFRGRGASTDVVDAAVRAFLNALNKEAQAKELEAAALRSEGELWGV
jgi:2-isopropylmalate synthase